jgi:hypothetical protein
MPDDVREWWHGWLSGETFVHPDAPAGGSGCGASRPPGSRGPLWSYSDVPHPEAPAGRYWLPASSATQNRESDADEDVAQVAKVFADKSTELLESLPDNALRAAFERHRAWVSSRRGLGHTVGNGRVDRETLMLRVQESVGWVAPHFTGAMLNNLEVTHGATAGALGSIENMYDAAKQSVHQQWTEAARAGRQRELLRTWTRNIERIERSVEVMRGTEQPDVPLKRGRLADLVPMSPSSAIKTQKTWVEFRLVDDDGAPIANAEFEVTLTDGSIMTGRLNSQGACRFENIDPGSCQIKFPEIDAKEWKPA